MHHHHAAWPTRGCSAGFALWVVVAFLLQWLPKAIIPDTVVQRECATLPYAAHNPHYRAATSQEDTRSMILLPMTPSQVTEDALRSTVRMHSRTTTKQLCPTLCPPIELGLLNCNMVGLCLSSLSRPPHVSPPSQNLTSSFSNHGALPTAVRLWLGSVCCDACVADPAPCSNLANGTVLDGQQLPGPQVSRYICCVPAR